MKTQSLFLNKKISTPIGAAVIIFFALLAGGFLFWQCQIMPKYEIPLIKFPLRPGNQVTITTDKTEYEQGEIIKITVRNGLDKSIWYVDGPTPPLAFWHLERFKNDTWKNIGYEYGYQLPVLEEGKEVCYAFIFEMPGLAELKRDSDISHEWNQKICVFDHKEEPWEPEFIDKGRYRFAFTYGLSKSSDEPEILMDSKTIYSNEFRIKEKEAGVIAAPKQFFLRVGEKEDFSFWNHNITVNYISSFPQQVLNVIVDGDKKVIKVDPTIECPNHHCGYYWQSENLDFSVRPIMWKTSEDTDERIWLYSETWNTTDLYFEASVIKSF